MSNALPAVPAYKRSLPPCPECRGVGHFTLQSRERERRSRVECPVCRGRAVKVTPQDPGRSE